jgi:isochorismate hydrolase
MKNNTIKEQYYSTSTITSQAQFFLKQITPLRLQHQIQINPETVALLVMDLQNFFVAAESHAYIPSAKAIIPKVLKLQNYCLKQGIKVIQTRHGNTKENAKMMFKWWHENILGLSDPMSEIVSAIANPKIPQILKTQYDAFYNTDLDSILKKNGIEQLIITGVMTHLCCETTARAAFTRGYEVFFTIDGTATYNSKFHLGTLTNLAHGFCAPMLIDELIALCENKS